MYQRPEFTLADAVRIQFDQIAEWKAVLKPSIHKALVVHAFERNNGVTDPYQVFRGQDITCFIQNHMCNIRNNKI